MRTAVERKPNLRGKTVVTCTPFIGRTEIQVNKAAQEPNFYSTPIVQRGKAQTSGDHVFSSSTPVVQKPGLQTVDSSVNTHQSAYAPFTSMVPIPVPPNVAMNQPVFGYSSTLPPAVSQMNGILVCSNTVNPANPIFYNGKGLNRGQVISWQMKADKPMSLYYTRTRVQTHRCSLTLQCFHSL